MYNLDEILKAQEIYEELENRIIKIGSAYIRISEEITGYTEYLYEYSVDEITGIDSDYIHFKTSDSCRGCVDYSGGCITMKYILADNYEELIRIDIAQKYEKELIEKQLKEKEKEVKQKAEAEIAKKKEYEYYLKLKEKYDN